jgi:ABC-2 type transport system permease protein
MSARTHALPHPNTQQAAAPLWQGSRIGTQIWVLTARAFRALITSPRLIIMALVMPLVMLGLFSQVFSSLASSKAFPAGVSYIDYLVPAILVNTAMQSALQSGVGLTEDIRSGVLARLRTLPIWMGSVLVARSFADLARAALQLAIMCLLATILFGFAPAGGVPGVLGAVAIALVVGWGIGWLFLALASWLRDAETMQTIGMVVMFPLMFASSAFVPVSSLPGWLQTVASINPLSYAVDAARNLSLTGTTATGTVLTVIAISIALLAIAGTIAAHQIRKP